MGYCATCYAGISCFFFVRKYTPIYLTESTRVSHSEDCNIWNVRGHEFNSNVNKTRQVHTIYSHNYLSRTEINCGIFIETGNNQDVTHWINRATTGRLLYFVYWVIVIYLSTSKFMGKLNRVCIDGYFKVTEGLPVARPVQFFGNVCIWKYGRTAAIKFEGQHIGEYRGPTVLWRPICIRWRYWSVIQLTTQYTR